MFLAPRIKAYSSLETYHRGLFFVGAMCANAEVGVSGSGCAVRCGCGFILEGEGCGPPTGMHAPDVLRSILQIRKILRAVASGRAAIGLLDSGG